MPITKGISIWPTRVAWPRRTEGAAAVPALLVAGAEPLPYETGRSRFTLSPLTLSLDQLLFLIVAALLCFGMVMVQSAEARVRGVNDHWLMTALANKNAIHAGIGLLAMALLWRLDYRHFLGRRLVTSPALVFLLVTVAALMAVLAFGAVLNGAKRWLMIPLGAGRLSIQPSELAKWSLVIFLAAYSVHRASVIRAFFRGFLPMILALAVVCGLIVKEDLGTTALIAGVAMMLILASGARWWHVLIMIPPALAAGLAFLLTSAYRMERVMVFLHGQSDQRAGYHITQSLLTIHSGGTAGRGLGNGIQKMGYLPEGNTDFIYVVLLEELGFIGGALVIGLFVALVLIGWRISVRCQDVFGRIIAFGITATIGLQAAMNIAVVTKSMPTKGIALPFISSGGTGWILTAAAVGLLMAIERQNQRERGIIRGPAQGEQGFPIETHSTTPALAIVAPPAAQMPVGQGSLP